MVRRILLILCLGAAVGTAGAQTFRPFTSLRVLQTEKFDIVFPERSRSSALTLAARADAVYNRISGLLGLEVPGRIAVTLTPDTDEFNGYETFFPYPHIVLFDTPLSLEWTAFDHSLEKLFFHELTHAVSLSTRRGFPAFLGGLFGSWVTPAVLNAPGFLVEGVTVSFESLDGAGRATDPAVKERVRQMIRENRFFTPFQAAGAWDGPAAADPSYEYGGLFSAWLQKTYGMETYGRLWQAMGSGWDFDLDWNKSGFFAVFRRVYGQDFDRAWADFLDATALRGLAEPEGPPVTNDRGRFYALDAAGGRLALVDGRTNRVTVRGPDGRLVGQWTPAESARDAALSPDGQRVLVSGYRYEGALATAVVTEYQAATGLPTGARWTGLWSARYLGERIVGLGADLHRHRIEVRDRQGGRQLVAQGTDTLLLGAPAPVTDDRLAFWAAEGGRRFLVVADLESGRLWRASTARDDDALRWAWGRNLRASGGRLWFDHNPDDGYSRAAVVEGLGGPAPTVRFGTRTWSGGVHGPVDWNGRPVYQAEFSEGDEVRVLAGGLDDPGAWTAPAALTLTPWEVPAPQADPVPARPPRETAYLPLAWWAPWKAWIPLPTLTTSPALAFTGAEATSWMADPTDDRSLALTLGWNQPLASATASGVYTDKTWGVPLTLSGGRTAVQDEAGGWKARDAAALALTWEGGLGSEGLRGLVSPSAGWTSEGSYGGTKVGLGSWLRQRRDLWAAGAGAAVQVQTDGSGWREDALVQGALGGVWPARGALWAWHDPAGASADGTSPVYGRGLTAEAAAPEAAPVVGEAPTTLAGAAFEVPLAVVEAQTNLGQVYFNRLFATAGARAAGVPGGAWASSVRGTLGAVVSLNQGMATLQLAPQVWGALRFQDPGAWWGLGLTLNW